jgi:hypothetical protein
MSIQSVRSFISESVELNEETGAALVKHGDGRVSAYSNYSDLQSALEVLAGERVAPGYGWDSEGRYMNNDGELTFPDPPPGRFVADILGSSSIPEFFAKRKDTPSEDRQSKSESVESDYIAFAVLGSKLRVVSLRPDLTYRYLDPIENVHDIAIFVPSEVAALQQAVEELESLLNDVKAGEAEFQKFFERNPDFILGEDHKKAHSQVALINQERDGLIPDFLLEPFDQDALCDLLEIKLPGAPVFVLKKNRMRYSAAVAEARAQLLEYSRYFDETVNQEFCFERYGLRAYKPKMFLIIGRLKKVDPYTRRKIETAEQPELYLRTYDDLIARVNARIERMKKGELNLPR